jgi:hypothetical protein
MRSDIFVKANAIVSHIDLIPLFTWEAPVLVTPA